MIDGRRRDVGKFLGERGICALELVGHVCLTKIYLARVGGLAGAQASHFVRHGPEILEFGVRFGIEQHLLRGELILRPYETDAQLVRLCRRESRNLV